MANRMILNETSYFGAGSISEIVTEAKKRAFKKALVVTDPDLIKFNVAKNVTDLLEEAGLAYDIFSQVKANPTVKVVKAVSKLLRQQVLTILSLSAAAHQWTLQRLSVSS